MDVSDLSLTSKPSPEVGSGQVEMRRKQAWSTSWVAFGTRSALPGNAATCQRTHLCIGAIRVSPLARLGRAKNSEDPRTWVATAVPRVVTASGRIRDLADLAAALGLPVDATLRMPDISVN